MRPTKAVAAAARYAIDGWKQKTFADVERAAAWKRRDEKLHSFVKASVPEALDHTGHAAFDEHLIGVQSTLRTFGADEDVCTAGLFHSLYGTEGFQGYKFPILRRPEIRDLIGPRAERMVWLFCVLDRKVFDDAVFAHGVAKPADLLARPELGRFSLVLRDADEWLDMLELVLADWVDQVEGAAEKSNALYLWKEGHAWSYRRTAYMQMKELLSQHRGDRGAHIKEVVDDVYARESLATKALVQDVTPPMSDAAKDARDALRSILL
ncbi:Aste57867_12722 [Aphanomyces stellatus]|uniref:Aste57867_12722 protein n=1 Tax=Aphanomyces stellatus TaxID=120398 RepID=A0A485KXP6_9STRA|nr:hypothetical protein As57867_012674 [Aphanomyces stellatus]VFT89572.1 Aste57867_12722 [Aphanomyces stellatus]